MKNLQTQWAQNKMQLFFCLVSTYLWGLAAHAYRFFGNYVSHDSLNEFHGAIVAWRYFWWFGCSRWSARESSF